ncbi:hypothetical protein ThrDRAFT_02522 [Frankia casuarinae]|uniref:Uncharacterized protein n=1 Tax=Frankia casuarinae (strain DSM 45818 / CECT 9043 / HFP020203 / CcI3) TaxID=106370 RepID=Q2J9G2_FRACC|nr:hypothetical protein [Frankia casuarinae]ABD12080.1 hypothetical protein Francci3_2720 [Frankia casuarinae]EYT91877.1 hypothetical protein ThrDRAFT_02522 [Frankia casuarinae]
MSHAFFSREIPSTVPAEAATREDMARVTEADWAAIVTHAHRYCWKVDGSRSRKRADRSATITRDGHAAYGTDDVSDDIAHDAVLIYARRLGMIIRGCVVASIDVTTREADRWQYQPHDADMFLVDRATIRSWAVTDAAQRNGYRPTRRDTSPEELETQAEHLAAVTYLSGVSHVVFAAAWGDGRDFPILRRVIAVAGAAEDLGRTGVFAIVAQQIYGGKYGSRRSVIKVRDAALAEARELTARCDSIRDALTHHDRHRRTTTTD